MSADSIREDASSDYDTADFPIISITLSRRGYEIITKVTRSMRPALANAILAITDTGLLIHAATERRLTYIDLDWSLFADYELLADEARDTTAYFINSLKPRNGNLLDFLLENAKQAKKDPFTMAMFTVRRRLTPSSISASDSNSVAGHNADYILKLDVHTENGNYARIKRSSLPLHPIVVPTDANCATVALEQYAHAELTKWLAEKPKARVHLHLTATSFYVTRVKDFVAVDDESVFENEGDEEEEEDADAYASSALEKEGATEDGPSFYAKWVQHESDKTSSAIMMHIARTRKQPGQRAVERQIKAERILGVFGPRKMDTRVTVTASELRSALNWMKISSWGVPAIRFFDDGTSTRTVAVTLFGQDKNSSVGASIVFLDTNRLRNRHASIYETPADTSRNVAEPRCRLQEKLDYSEGDDVEVEVEVDEDEEKEDEEEKDRVNAWKPNTDEDTDSDVDRKTDKNLGKHHKRPAKTFHQRHGKRDDSCPAPKMQRLLSPSSGEKRYKK